MSIVNLMQDAARQRTPRLIAEEVLILEATEAICERMDRDEGLTRKALAKRLGRSKGFISQILSGKRNMTLRTLAQFADALGCKVEVTLSPIPSRPGEKSANSSSQSTVAVHSFPGIDGDWVRLEDARAVFAAQPNETEEADRG